MNNFNIDELQNAVVIDQNGDKVGNVGQIFLDDQTNEPTWTTVNTGLFGMKETFVPLRGANIANGEIRVPYEKGFIKDAPNMDADAHLDEAQQDELYRYYNYTDDRAGVVGERRDYVEGDRRVETDVNRGVDVDRDRRVEGGDSVVRHEEEVRVGKERVETGRVRLRKHVVTEHKTITVPVEREEVQVVREPIADGDRGGRIGDEGDVEMTLSEERPVVQKDVVAKERVGLDKNVVEEQRQVQADVAKEQVEVERDGGVRGDRQFAEGDVRRDVNDDRSLGDKVKDKLDRDNDGKIG